MKGYEVKVVNTLRELAAKEKVKFKMAQDLQSLNDLVKTAPVEMKIHNVVTLDIHNPQTKERDKDGNQVKVEKDYTRYIIEDKEGNLYQTSSESLYEALMMIIEELGLEEDYEVRILAMPSTNFAGNFLTAELV